jgi:predicted carbohydrate-binding protein with CBM5 and CBM33 domain
VEGEEQVVHELTEGNPCHARKNVEGKPGHGGMTYSLVDKVQVPEQKGEYILSFRWDCEQTAQVWNSCADVVIVDRQPPNVVV